MQFGNDLGNGLGAEMQAFLDKTLLTNLTQNAYFDRLATMTRALPLKNSQELRFDKWIRMQDIYLTDNINQNFTGNVIDPANNVDEETYQNVPASEYENFVLAEGSSGASKAKMKLIKTKATVFPIGDWMPYTEELELFHNRWSTSEAMRQMSETAALVVDGFYRDLYFYGAGSDSVNDPAFSAAERNLYLALKLSGGKPMKHVLSSSPDYGTVPVNSRYVAYGHTVACDRLRDNADFIPLKDYADGVTPLPNEVGMLGFTRFCEDPNGYISGSGGEYDAEFIVCGNDHTAQIPLKGKGRMETVYQRLGSGGTSDALARVGSLGWKSVLGAKVLYPERLGILKAKFQY